MSAARPSDLVVPDGVILKQRKASDPAGSAWVSANAGSGKTKVLVDRVLRLLLAGVRPDSILCLTFTKAAAATMSNRVFAELARWVTLDDAVLSQTIAELTGAVADARIRLRARRLFACAVETPGRLRIETIHAFCERVLHLFPFEANVPARFEVLDDLGAKEVFARGRRRTLLRALSGEDSALSEALTSLAREVADEGLADLFAALLKHREEMGHLSDPERREAALAGLAAMLGLAPGDDEAANEAALLSQGLLADDWDGLASALEASPNKTDNEQAARLRQAAASQGVARREALLSLFYNSSGAPKAQRSIFTSKVPPDAAEALCVEAQRIAALLDKGKALAIITRTRHALILGTALHAEIVTEKNLRGLLDFDDLITCTRSLLVRAGADWVLYKLDAGIEHLLVDEAQDTPPGQWAILNRLTEAFADGEGIPRQRRRTLFAVGDPKQSIYGFQGAEPRLFEETGLQWRKRASRGEEPFEDVRLLMSFRSAWGVLSAVDAVFRVPEHFRGLSFADKVTGTTHESARPNAPGRVDLWDIVRPPIVEERAPWDTPVDAPGSTAIVLGERIASVVKHWIETGDEHGRRIAPGEILVLARKRDAAFEATVRALKDAGVPVAGADRIVISNHIAVHDLIAAARAALLPQDDLNLAAALVSPLGALDQEALMSLAMDREPGLSLVEAIRLQADAGNANAVRACARLDGWVHAARSGGPVAFLMALTGPMGGRLALVSRLGAEAGDAVDALIGDALAYERRAPASLAGFVASFGTDERSLKRDLETDAHEVRVMTVHGAKGLEASAVILIDDCGKPGKSGREVVLYRAETLDSVLPVWCPRKADRPLDLEPFEDARQAAALEEHNRLLYVAMTRARDRLVLASHMSAKPNKDGIFPDPPPESWTGMIHHGLAEGVVLQPGRDHWPEELVEQEDPAGFGYRAWHVAGNPGEATAAVEGDSVSVLLPDALPDWLTRPPVAERAPLPPLRPSRLLDAADRLDRPVERADGSRQRLKGVLVHALLERLPDLPTGERQAVAAKWLAVRGATLDPAERDRLVHDALAILDHAELAPLFAPGSRAEVPVAGMLTLGEGGRMHPVSGQIDRLAVTQQGIWLADFKTGTNVPADARQVPESQLAQTAIYAALLAEIHPGLPVRPFLVYTAERRVIPLPEALWRGALMRLVPFASA